MTIQEVLSIKEEKSQKTKNMNVSELKVYYADCMRNFNSTMNKLIRTIPNDIENFLCAEDKDEYSTKE